MRASYILLLTLTAACLVLAVSVQAQTEATGVGALPPNGNGQCPCTNGIPENEPDCGGTGNGTCVDTVNGGCNSNPFIFSPISCNTTICGTVGTANCGQDFRDTDWYELNLPIADTVTITVTAEFPVALFTVSLGNPACSNIQLINSAFAVACGGPAQIVEAMQQGLNYIFVSTNSIFTGIPCGTEYTLTVTCAVVPVELESIEAESE